MKTRPETTPRTPPKPGKAAPHREWMPLGLVILILAAAVVLVLYQEIGGEGPVSDGRQISAADEPRECFLSDAALAGAVVPSLAEAEQATLAVLPGMLDTIFAPVRWSVPAYTDFHYSVPGQYTELSAALLGTASAGMEARLFPLYDEQLATVLASIDDHFETRLAAALRANADASCPEGLLTAASQKVIDATIARARYTKPVQVIVAPAAGMGSAHMARSLSKTLFSRLGTLAARSTLRPATAFSGALGGAGAGALFGSVVGPVGSGIGAALGGALGTAATWLGLDYAFIAVDEYFNRPSFEMQLHDLIGDAQSRVEAHVAAAIAERRRSIAGKTLRELRAGFASE